MPEKSQTITLVLSDGRQFHFTGPAGLKMGDSVAEILFGPEKELPAGCRWEVVEESKDD